MALVRSTCREWADHGGKRGELSQCGVFQLGGCSLHATWFPLVSSGAEIVVDGSGEAHRNPRLSLARWMRRRRRASAMILSGHQDGRVARLSTRRRLVSSGTVLAADDAPWNPSPVVGCETRASLPDPMPCLREARKRSRPMQLRQTSGGVAKLSQTLVAARPVFQRDAPTCPRVHRSRSRPQLVFAVFPALACHAAEYTAPRSAAKRPIRAI